MVIGDGRSTTIGVEVVFIGQDVGYCDEYYSLSMVLVNDEGLVLMSDSGDWW